MKVRSFVAIVLLLAPCLTSCIEFESQEVRYKHEPATDTLLVTLLYQGVYGKVDGNSPPDGLSEHQLEQLDSVLNGERAFFFNNWISEFNRESLEDALKTYDQSDEPKPAGDAGKAFLQALLKRTKVGNLGFFVDDKGRLCGAQTLRIEKFDDLLALANAALAAGIKSHEPEMRKELEKGQANAYSKESVDGLVQAGESGFPFLSRQGNLIRLRFPLDERDFAKVSDELGPPESFPSSMRLGYHDGVVSIDVGASADDEIFLVKKCFRGYRPNLLRHIREKHPELLRTRGDVERELKAFLAAGD